MKIQIIDPILKQMWEKCPNLFQPQTEGSGGIDMYACIDKVHTINPGEIYTFGTGIKIAIPSGWLGILAPRSGLGKRGIVIAHTIGIIDSDYRGEIKLPLLNRNQKFPEKIEPMSRVAQLSIIPHFDYKKLITSTDELSITIRGDKGFGHTGI